MLSLIEVTCPHCGARGQIMLPPVGTIIVGPCPECQGLVVVFCGHILGLDKEIMLNGTIEERRDHMLTVLTRFLKERISTMVVEAEGEETSSEPVAVLASHQTNSKPPATPSPVKSGNKLPPISDSEFKTFKNVELKLLDNRDYFKAIFG